MPGTSASVPPPSTPPGPRALTPAWWFRDRDGKVVLAQAPNPPLLVWLATVLVGWTGVLDGDRATTLTRIGQGALVVWAVDELARGVTPARRVLGAVVLTVLLLRLFA